MNSGNDTYMKYNFSGCMIAATRFDVKNIFGSGFDIVYRQCLFQYNEGYAIRMRCHNSETQHYGSVIIDNRWFEENGKIGDAIIIDGITE